MATPIKDTPILTGKDARRFEQRMKEVKPLPKEEIDRMMEALKLFQKMGVFKF